jgi:tetratricopeptide (TPR) repeat protein
MSKISLRDYNHEIEGLINSGKTDEAIAHCKYILRLFPKCVDTYRLLGKAYLEAQRYSEATDILTRILSVVPDDFVSQIGMSIIREDEGNLDAAIYHMERAFEVKPSNSAIQEELRRLYGRRDGITPPRVRLTRGALVRMYTRGELYPQAIAEIRASLAEDPKRVDLEVILARIYMILGRKAETIEVCSRLVSKLPNCLEANRILAEILPGTSRSEDAEAYHLRVIALDPYSADISSSAPTSNDVPDNAIMVDFLEYQPPQPGAQQPEWASSVGVNFQDTEEPVPDWLVAKPVVKRPALPDGTPAPASQPETTTPDQPVQQTPAAPMSQPAEAAPAQPASEDALIPDWMKTAGWGEAAASPVDAPAAPAPAGEGAEEIAPAEIPDWLKAIAPTGESEPAPAVNEQEDLAKLDQLLTSQPIEPVVPEQAAPVQAAPVDVPESTPAEAIAQPEEITPAADLPAWLEEQTPAPAFSGEAQPASNEEVPDWLAGLSIPTEAEPAPAEATPAEELPDWLKTFAAETPAVSGVEPVSEASPDWLKDLQEKTEPAPAEATPVSEAPVQPEEPMPDWLKGFGEAIPAVAAMAETTPVEPQPEAPVIPPVAEAAPEPVVSIPEAVQPFEPAIPPEPEAVVPEPMPEVPAVPFEAALTSEAVPAEVSAEEPAAKTQPMAVRKTEAPVEEVPVQEALAVVAPEPAIEPVAAEIPVSEPAVLQEPVAAEEPATAEEPAPEPVAQESVAGEMPTDIDAALAWLESLAAKQGAGEENMLIPQDQRTEAPPAWIQKEIDNAKAAAVETPAQAEAETPVAPEFEPEPVADVEVPTPAAAEVLEPTPAAAEVLEPTQAAAELVEPEPVESAAPVAAAAVEEIPTQEPPKAVEAAPAAEAATPEATSPAEMDLDAAFAWLESLAARQGAEPETLSVPAEERQEQPPAWVQEAAAEAEAMPVIVPEPAAELPTAMEEPAPQPLEPEPVLSNPLAAETEIPEVLPPEPEIPVAVIPVEEPVEEEPLPDWLKGLETPAVGSTLAPAPASGESVSTWLKNIQVPEEELAGAIPEQPVAETPVEPLPEWLQGIEPAAVAPVEPLVPAKEPAEDELPEWLQDTEAVATESTGASVEEGLPEWLQGLETTAETVGPQVIPIEPVVEEIPVEQPVELAPVEESLPVAEAAPEAAAALEQPEVTSEIPVAQLEEIAQPAETPAPEEKPAEEVPAAVPAATPVVDHSQVFAEAQGSLDAGDIDQALPKYVKLIESHVYLEEIIRDLQNALYRSPVDVGLHETLGDAFAQSNRLQEALDTYTKAEELLVK